MFTIISNYKKLLFLILKNNFYNEEEKIKNPVSDNNNDWTRLDDLVKSIAGDEVIDWDDLMNVEFLEEEMDDKKNDIYIETKTKINELMKESLIDMLKRWYTVKDEKSYDVLKILLNRFDIWYYLPHFLSSDNELFEVITDGNKTVSFKIEENSKELDVYIDGKWIWFFNSDKFSDNNLIDINLQAILDSTNKDFDKKHIKDVEMIMDQRFEIPVIEQEKSKVSVIKPEKTKIPVLKPKPIKWKLKQ